MPIDVADAVASLHAGSHSMLLSMHVPKCAGTSFRFILRERFGESLWPNYGRIFWRGEARAGVVPSGTACIHGHFLADTFDELFPECTLITWLRHPVDRLVSTYHYFLRVPDWQNECCRALHERKLSLVEFAQLPWMQNEATRYFAGKGVPGFAFVGVTERFAESLQVLAHTLGWTAPLAPRRDNFNPAHDQLQYEVAPDDRAAIVAVNASDLALYEEAAVRLDRAVAALGDALAPRIRGA